MATEHDLVATPATTGLGYSTVVEAWNPVHLFKEECQSVTAGELSLLLQCPCGKPLLDSADVRVPFQLAETAEAARLSERATASWISDDADGQGVLERLKAVKGGERR